MLQSLSRMAVGWEQQEALAADKEPFVLSLVSHFVRLIKPATRNNRESADVPTLLLGRVASVQLCSAVGLRPGARLINTTSDTAHELLIGRP